jgi:ribonuclease T1
MGHALQKFGLALLLAGTVLGPAAARGPATQARVDRLPSVALAELPPEARETQALILRGGPFAYRKDGAIFGNRERLLPSQSRGYYREYTVRTPGAPDRGARRIVCGGVQARQPDDCFYTADHYASFRRIAP